jgi:hypothetical protein
LLRAARSGCLATSAKGQPFASLVTPACMPDGSLLLFEANATMAIIPLPPDPIWDYRRPTVTKVLAAASRLLPVAGASHE